MKRDVVEYALAFIFALLLIGAGFYIYTVGGNSLGTVASGPQEALPAGADAATFVSLCPGEPQCKYFKDKNYVYFGNLILRGADPATFEILDGFYAKDKNHVYYYNPQLLTVPEIVPGDPATFKNLGGDGLYTADENFVYWNNAPLVGADPATFSEVGSGGQQSVYGVDQTTVYHEGDPMQADSTTFKVVDLTNNPNTPPANGNDDGYTEDGTTVFYDGTPLPGVDPTTFTPPPDGSSGGSSSSSDMSGGTGGTSVDQGSGAGQSDTGAAGTGTGSSDGSGDGTSAGTTPGGILLNPDGF